MGIELSQLLIAFSRLLGRISLLALQQITLRELLLASPSTSDSDLLSIDQLVALEQLRMVHRNTQISQVMSFLIALLTTLVLWPVQEQYRLLSWFGVSILTIFLRLALSNAFLKLDQAGIPIAIAHWERRTRLGAFLSGIIWGNAAIWLYPTNNPSHELFLCLMLVGVSTGAVSLQAPLSGAFTLYGSAIMLPLSAILALKGEFTYFIVAIAALLELYTLIISAERYRHNLADSQRLRFKNEALINTLTTSTEAALAAKNEADSANLAKSEFLANMSHEIRTPMNAILGLTHLGLSAPVEQQQEYLRKINDSAGLLLNILNDILDFSKIEAGKVSLENVIFDLHNILERSSSIIGAQAREKQLDFTVQIDANTPRYLQGDPFRLGQVLVNLASNAVKFTERGSVKVEVTAKETVNDQLILTIAVTDTGIGLTMEQQQRLFQAFSQADSSTTRKFGGTGLGLAISKRLVALMGGQIAVKSQYGYGSTFSFSAIFNRANPPHNTDALETLTQSPVTQADLDRLRGMRVLVAEDNPINQQIIRELLEKKDLQVTLVENGLQAVETARDQSFDTVLLDIQMPVMDGLQAARELRKLPHYRNTLIIALTANVFQTDIERCTAAGMNAHIGKPIKVDELFATLVKGLTVMEPTLANNNPQPSKPLLQSPAMSSDAYSTDQVLDIATALDRIGNNPALLKKLLVLFRQTEAETPQRLRQALAAGDTVLARRLAHTLKSTAGTVGANRLHLAAREIEQTLLNTEEITEALLTTLEATHQEVMAELQKLEAAQ